MPEHFATVIRRYRRGLDWTQEELSAKSGVSVGAVKAVESGRSAYWPTLANLALAMGMQFSQLVIEAETIANAHNSHGARSVQMPRMPSK